MATFAARMIGAARLDAATYEEVEHDGEATGQAAGVVVLASVAAGIGVSDDMGITLGLIGGAIASLAGWLAWAFTTYVIGTRVLPGPSTQADLGQMLRTLGFSNSPGLLNVLGIVPGIGALVPLVVGLWTLAAMVVAIRQALDYEGTGRAIAVCLLGVVAYVVVMFVVAFLLAGLLGRGMD
jgi:hypothetical protein